MTRTFKTKSAALLWVMLIPLLTANCSDKKNVEKAAMADAATKKESVIQVSAPPFQKFVVVTTEETALYQKADTNSPNLVRWIESDCESDFCENIYQWSDQPGKPGFELSTDIIASEGTIYPVLGEEGQFYRVCPITLWCNIESAYIPKNSVGDIESAPIKADMLESGDNYFKCHVVKNGKYKDIVLIDKYDELDGETLQVGVLSDGAVATPVVYNIDSQMLLDLKESDMQIEVKEGTFFQLRYGKGLAVAVEEDFEAYQLDPNKLSTEQIAKIVDTVTKKQPEYVEFMYHFPAMGLQSFYYKAK